MGWMKESEIIDKEVIHWNPKYSRRKISQTETRQNFE